MFITYHHLNDRQDTSVHAATLVVFEKDLRERVHDKRSELRIVNKHVVDFVFRDSTRDFQCPLGHLVSIDKENALGWTLCRDLWPYVHEGIQWFKEHGLHLD